MVACTEDGEYSLLNLSGDVLGTGQLETGRVHGLREESRGVITVHHTQGLDRYRLVRRSEWGLEVHKSVRRSWSVQSGGVVRLDSSGEYSVEAYNCDVPSSLDTVLVRLEMLSDGECLARYVTDRVEEYKSDAKKKFTVWIDKGSEVAVDLGGPITGVIHDMKEPYLILVVGGKRVIGVNKEELANRRKDTIKQVR